MLAPSIICRQFAGQREKKAEKPRACRPPFRLVALRFCAGAWWSAAWRRASATGVSMFSGGADLAVPMMKTLMTHSTAAVWWLLAAHPPNDLRRSSAVMKAPEKAPSASRARELVGILNERGLGISRVHVLVSSANGRRMSDGLVCHVASRALPAGSICRVGDTLYVVSPELCFLQMASSLSLANLVRLGFALCGIHALSEESETGTVVREPLTTVERLASFIDEARFAGLPNTTKAARALAFVRDRSASPRETDLALQLGLPLRYGGFGCGMPIMNHRIVVPEELIGVIHQSYFESDLFFPDANVGLEYQSTACHADAQAIGRDAIRAANLDILGVTVKMVTDAQYKSLAELEKIAALIERDAGKRPSLQDRKRDEGQYARELERRARLHGELSESLIEILRGM